MFIPHHTTPIYGEIGDCEIYCFTKLVGGLEHVL